MNPDFREVEMMEQQSKKLEDKRSHQQHHPTPARWIAVILLLGLLLSACAPAPTPTQPPPPPPAQPTPAGDLAPGGTPLVSTFWVLKSYGDPKNPTPVETGTSIDALFSPAGSLSGFSGCNTYTARYVVTGSSMRLDQPISTYLSCPQGMQQEGVYLSALVSVISYKITGSSLEIVYDHGNGLLKYSAQVQPSGTSAP
jgi:heat shock protein HslJ